jgi:hypothetical protein
MLLLFIQDKLALLLQLLYCQQKWIHMLLFQLSLAQSTVLVIYLLLN